MCSRRAIDECGAWDERIWWSMRGLGLGFTNPAGTGGVLDVCLCLGCGGVCGERVGVGSGSGGVMSVVSRDSLYRWQVQISV